MSARELAPFEHTGDSANIAYYGERAPAHARPPGRVWCSVLRSDLERRDGELARKRVPDFHITVHSGRDELARFTYTPRARPGDGALPARTVARLVREQLGARSS